MLSEAIQRIVTQQQTNSQQVKSNSITTSAGCSKSDEEWDRLLKIELATMQRFNNTKVDGHTCNHCKGRGAVMTVVNDRSKLYPYTAVIPCGCLYSRVNEVKVENSGLREQVQQQNFDTYKTDNQWQEKIKAVAEGYTTFETDKWFYLCGNVGSGKTHICTAVADKMLKKGSSVLYMMWRDVVGKLKRLATSSEYDEILEKYKSVEVLYIDDFLKTANKAKPTDADMQIAFELINYRDLKGLKTIISSEFKLEEVMSFDEATGSRILKRADDYYITLSNAENYRLKG